MTTSALLLGYQDKIVSLQAAAAQLRSGQIVALLLLIAAVATVGLLAFLSMARSTVPLGAALLPLPVAVYAQRLRLQRNKNLLGTLRLAGFYERCVERLEGRWAGMGASGNEFAPEADHPYAADLHVFGEGSLFELVCTCRTEVGRRHLAQYFLTTPSVAEARRLKPFYGRCWSRARLGQFPRTIWR